MSTAPVATRSSLVRRLAICSLAALLTGIVVGLVWWRLAKPAMWEARETGLVLTEAAARGQFSVVVVFVIAGVVASVVFGWVAARLLPDLGWMLVPLVIVLTSLAAVVAWRVGVELGPPSPGSVRGVTVGDRVPSELAIDSVPPFLAWPVFGLLGLIAATWAADRRRGATD